MPLLRIRSETRHLNNRKGALEHIRIIEKGQSLKYQNSGTKIKLMLHKSEQVHAQMYSDLNDEETTDNKMIIITYLLIYINKDMFIIEDRQIISNPKFEIII